MKTFFRDCPARLSKNVYILAETWVCPFPLRDDHRYMGDITNWLAPFLHKKRPVRSYVAAGIEIPFLLCHRKILLINAIKSSNDIIKAY